MAASLDHRITGRKQGRHGRAGRARDGDTFATSGLVGIGCAEEISIPIETRFTAGDGPHGLTLVYPAGHGAGAGKGPQPPGARGPGTARPLPLDERKVIARRAALELKARCSMRGASVFRWNAIRTLSASCRLALN